MALGYTRLVMRWLLFLLSLTAALGVPCPRLSQDNRAQPAVPQGLETGKLLPRISCAAHPEQSYALYLPSNYSPEKRWPLVLSSDPGGRGRVALEIQKDAAERLGYVLASSNNSRNGPSKPRFEATEATLTDVQTRVSIDTSQVYFAGFSGGARLSSQIATVCKCSAGVLLSGAGFTNGLSPSADSVFPVFSAVGTVDFNYPEMIPLQDSLAEAGYPHWLRVFEGKHEWPPAEVMEEALAWFRIQSMKVGRDPRDPKFIDAQLTKAQGRAQALEKSGELLGAWREYSQMAATYDSLVDVTAIHAKVDTLAKDKAVRDAVKREENEFREQEHITAAISAGLLAPAEATDAQREADRDLQDQIVRLRQSAEQEKHPEKARVLKRALDDIFVTIMESGNSFLEQKKFPAVIRLYEFAAVAHPDAEWAWEQLAVARALGGRKKDAITALRRAHSAASDKGSFAKWLQSETAFDTLRSAPDFQDLLKEK